MEVVLALVIGYLVGGIDFGAIVPRLMGVDIYAEGSGNPGTSNVFRTMGKKAGAAVLVGDALKGLVAAAVGDLIGPEALGFAAAFAAVVGHVLPVWLRFRGGRGVATAIGGAIWLEPVAGVALAVIWAAIVLATKVASVASLVAMALYVPAFAIFGHRGWSLVWAAAAAALVVIRHAPNIKRMVAGSESTVTS